MTGPQLFRLHIKCPLDEKKLFMMCIKLWCQVQDVLCPYQQWVHGCVAQFHEAYFHNKQFLRAACPDALPCRHQLLLGIIWSHN